MSSMALTLLRQLDRLIEQDGVLYCRVYSLNGWEEARVSKYTLAVPTQDQWAATMAQVLVTEWFYKFGVPSRLHSVRGEPSNRC